MIKPSVFPKDNPLYTQDFVVDEDITAIVIEDGTNDYVIFGLQVPKPEHKKEIEKAIKLIEKAFGITKTDRVYKLKKGSQFIPTNIQYSLDSMDVLLMNGDPFEYAMLVK